MAFTSRVCPQPGCPHIVPCPEHGDPQAAWQGSNRKARLPKGWQRIRRRILRRDPICQLCGINQSTQVDHITPGDDHSDSNLQGVCDHCHRRKSSEEGRKAKEARRANRS